MRSTPTPTPDIALPALAIEIQNVAMHMLRFEVALADRQCRLVLFDHKQGRRTLGLKG